MLPGSRRLTDKVDELNGAESDGRLRAERTLLISRCINQRGAGHIRRKLILSLHLVVAA